MADELGHQWEAHEATYEHKCDKCGKPVHTGARVWEYVHPSEIPGERYYYWRCDSCMTGKPAPRGRHTPRGMRYTTTRVAGRTHLWCAWVYENGEPVCVGHYEAKTEAEAYRQEGSTTAGALKVYRPASEDGQPVDGTHWGYHLGTVVDSMHAAWLATRPTE